MRKLLVKARTRIGYAAVGALVTVAAGGATAAAVMSPATDEVSDVSTVTTQPVETTAVPEAQTNVPAPVPPDSPAVDAPAGSVEGVTEPEQANAPGPVVEPPQATELPARFTDVDGTVYQPAPDVPVEKLPSEPGYVPPNG